MTDHVSQHITMLPRLFLAFLIYSLSSATDTFLSSNPIRKGQVQNVLEHHPVKAPACQHTVRFSLVHSTFVRSFILAFLADRSYRNNNMRLRNHRKH
jgi:hypothetical protein